ncbi:hypothetical protein ZIOFF_028447 [Zingiber officinale]|uniref:Uncharacterized protein n=1 Tax=Zingiber officinale TaxID=94328 RepID=A0A8J5GUZ5_ZINOF|nr:hypothetical protein ZIOFF_028447 [Zingiber officinale]
MNFIPKKLLFIYLFSCLCSDTFDENTPPLDDPNYISSLGSAIYKGMQSGDDNAVWLMQVIIYKLFIQFYICLAKAHAFLVLTLHKLLVKDLMSLSVSLQPCMKFPKLVVVFSSITVSGPDISVGFILNKFLVIETSQGWLFSYDPFWKPPQMKALLHSVPIGHMVVLDLFAEVKPIWFTSEQFYGVPYIWKVPHSLCMLHNFAGNIEMYGILDSIALGPIEAQISKNSTMVGVGMSMEGIEQNPIVYDLMSEMAFHHKPVNVKVNFIFSLMPISCACYILPHLHMITTNAINWSLIPSIGLRTLHLQLYSGWSSQHRMAETSVRIGDFSEILEVWVDQYASRRYGKNVSGLQEAWQILYHTLYNCTDGAYDKNRDVIVAFPDVDPSVILIPELSGRKYFRGHILKRRQMKETTDSYEHPHLWYSVSDVINALVLFLENGDEVADSHTFR